MKMSVLAAAVIASIIVTLVDLVTPAAASTSRATGEIAVVVISMSGGATQTVRTAGPTGENLLCDKFYVFADKSGEFTLQHQCGGYTAPWGYRISPALRAIAVSPVSEQGVDWTKNGVRQPRQAPHLEAADYIFHGTFPNSPDGTVISYSNRFSFRHGVNGGGEVTIEIKGTFTLTGDRA